MPGSVAIDIVYSFSQSQGSSWLVKCPALSHSPDQVAPRNCVFIDRILSIMPARHRERYSSSIRKLSTITPAPCPPSSRIGVHDTLESLSVISRNNHLADIQDFFRTSSGH